MNPLNPAILALFKRLNFVHFIVLFLDGRLRELQRDLEDQGVLALDRDDGWRAPLQGTSLLITDLTGPTDNGWLYHHYTGQQFVEGREYYEMIGWFGSREGALAAAQAYEAFETFLYDITGEFLSDDSSSVDKSRFEHHLPKSSSHDVNAWQDAVRGLFRQKANSELIDCLCTFAPKLSTVENKHSNNRHIDLRDWYIAVGHVRHAVTHANMVVSENALHRMSTSQATLLKRLFPGSMVGDNYKLALGKDSAVYSLKLFAEYAHAIYQALSQSVGYEWENIFDETK